MSFDLLLIQHLVLLLVRLNPFRTGRCLSTEFETQAKALGCLNPFRTGRCLSTFRNLYIDANYPKVSIPFEQGDVFRPTATTASIESASVSIPFEQGDVFRRRQLLFA